MMLRQVIGVEPGAVIRLDDRHAVLVVVGERGAVAIEMIEHSAFHLPPRPPLRRFRHLGDLRPRGNPAGATRTVGRPAFASAIGYGIVCFPMIRNAPTRTPTGEMTK